MNLVHSNFTGSVPLYYQSGLVPAIFEDYAVDLARRVAACEPISVLELASGTGVLTRLLRDTLAKETRIIASDLNEPMLEVARQKFKAGEAVTFKAVNAMDIPLGDGAVDVIACQFGVMFFPDKVRSYREAHRVLGPGGRYIFSAWDSHDHNPFAALAQAVIEVEYPDNTPGFYHVPFHYHNANKMKQDMETAGFSSVDVEQITLTKEVRSLKAFAAGLVSGNPLAEEVRIRGGDPEVLIAKILGSFEAEFGVNGNKMPLSAYVVTGIK